MICQNVKILEQFTNAKNQYPIITLCLAFIASISIMLNRPTWINKPRCELRTSESIIICNNAVYVVHHHCDLDADKSTTNKWHSHIRCVIWYVLSKPFRLVNLINCKIMFFFLDFRLCSEVSVASLNRETSFQFDAVWI